MTPSSAPQISAPRSMALRSYVEPHLPPSPSPLLSAPLLACAAAYSASRCAPAAGPPLAYPRRRRLSLTRPHPHQGRHLPPHATLACYARASASRRHARAVAGAWRPWPRRISAAPPRGGAGCWAHEPLLGSAPVVACCSRPRHSLAPSAALPRQPASCLARGNFFS
jgi:hypothetical protein